MLLSDQLLIQRTDSLFHSLHLPALSATCTESLTPFLSLLPCGSFAGIAQLVNPYKIFDGVYTEIGVHYYTRPSDVQHSDERFRQSDVVRLELKSILDPVRAERLSGGPGRRGESITTRIGCLLTRAADFSLHSLFDRTITKTCVVADSSEIRLLVPTGSTEPFTISPESGRRSALDSFGREQLNWDTGLRANGLDAGLSLDVSMKWSNEMKFIYRTSFDIAGGLD